MNFIIDYLIKHAWPLGVIALLLGVIGLYHLSNAHKDSVIAGLKAQNVEQGIALMRAQSIAEEQKRLVKENAKKAAEYRITATLEDEEIRKQEFPVKCQEATDMAIELLNH